MDEQKKKNAERQITLHFSEDTKHILEKFEEIAKSEMRTTEAQIIWYLLNSFGKEEK